MSKRKWGNRGRAQEESSSDGNLAGEKSTNKVQFSFDSHNDKFGSTRNYRNLQLAQATNEIQSHYIGHKKEALWHLKSKIGQPNFPSSLWEPILLNQFIDFGKIHAVRSGDVADEETVHKTDHFKFVINQIKSRGPTTTEGAWMGVFNAYARAVKYTYPHRNHELSNYQDRMQEIFRVGGHLKINSIVKVDQSF